MLKDTEYIDALIGKYLSGEAGPAEAMELEDWKNLSADNLDYFNRSQRVFALTSGLSFPQADTAAAWEKINPATKPGAKVVSMGNGLKWRMAASIAVLLALGIALVYVLRSPEQPPSLAFESGAGQRPVNLPDRSVVQMDPHTQLTADAGFGKTNRTVHLRGMARFTVQHDNQLPFVVDAGQVYIKDIGTVFTVDSRAGHDSVWVTVTEGSVELYDSLGASVVLHASERACYIRSGHRIARPAQTEPGHTLAFHFEDTRLGDVCAQLSQAYQVPVQLHNPALAGCTITTSFEGKDLETILSIVTETLGLSFEKTAGVYLIKGQACNP